MNNHPTMKRAWYCSRIWPHPGPCALYPKWWNFRGWITFGR